MTTKDVQPDKPTTFSFQESLPRLPVPKLEASCEKILEWNSVLLDENTLARSREVLADFIRSDGDGPKLQKRLEEWAEKPEVKNWLEDFWNESYLSYRKPLCINSNVFYLLDTIPALNNLSQTQIATSLVLAILRFKQHIDAETLAVDMERDQPLCMIQYTKLFTTTRIPQQGCDVRKNPHSTEYPNPKDARHIVVFYKGQPVRVDVLDESGQPRSHEAINTTLQKIIEDIDSETTSPQVGILTTFDRDTWAQARQRLLAIGKENERLINTIETALFVVCLDDSTPKNLTETARTMMHGNGKNRWFDKSMQLIVCPNGVYGVSAEHSGLDGSVIGRMFKLITKAEYDHFWLEENAETCSFKRLAVQTNDEITALLKQAEAAFATMTANTSVQVLEFSSFGKTGIKNLKVSPDAYIQLAMQRAQHRLFGKCENVYEPVMTRRYLHGRTEAARTVTPESLAFVQAMADPGSNDYTRAELLHKAAKAHVSRLVEAKNGHGIQRHFMGLLKIYERYGAELGITEKPQIFSDPLWTKMCYDIFSTSTSDPVGLALAGYGPVVDDGFGIRYVTKNNAIYFTISSRTANKDTLEQLYCYIQEALVELEGVLKSGS